MKDLTITFGIFECDDDWVSKLNKLIISIETRIKSDFDLLLIDDRKDQTIDVETYIELKYDNLKIIRHGCNKRCWNVRITALNNCDSKFIWFIDMDDDIIRDYDFSFLSNMQTSQLIHWAHHEEIWGTGSNSEKKTMEHLPKLFKNGSYVFYKPRFYTLNVNSNDDKIFYCNEINNTCTYWSKLINVDFFKECLKDIDLSKFEGLNYSDDTLGNIIFCNHLTQIGMIDDYNPYLYHRDDPYKYLPSINGEPNTNISDELVKSWIRVKNNISPTFMSNYIFKNLQKFYTGVDFKKYNIDWSNL